MVHHLYPPFPGGAADAVYRLSTELARQGHDVTVYTARTFRGETAPPEEVREGVTVRRVGVVLSGRLAMGRTELSPGEILRAMERKRPDVVHFHGLAFPANDLVALRLKGVPIVLTGHGPVWPHEPHSGWHRTVLGEAYMTLLGKRVLRRVGKVVAITRHEVRYWRQWGVPPDRIEVIPWGIPADCFSSHGGTTFRERTGLRGPILLYVGALHPTKGPQWLIRALPGILDKFPTVAVVLCGQDAGYRAHLESLSRQLGVEDRVRVLGYVSRADLLEAYDAADIFVLPSDYEAFGLVLGEAMAFGKPIVATRAGAIPFVVEDGGNALLVNPRDPADLTAKVDRLLADAEMRKAYASRSRAMSARYSWATVAHEYERVYVSSQSQD